jgi:hypothetical protein
MISSISYNFLFPGIVALAEIEFIVEPMMVCIAAKSCGGRDGRYPFLD